VLSLLALFLRTLAGSPACELRACSCISTTDPQPTVEASAAVFVGRVISVTGTSGDTGSLSPDGLPVFMDSVAVVAEEGWKGSPPDTVRAGIQLTGPDCPTRFVPGRRYLMYMALRNGIYLVVGPCTRTSQLDSELAKNDVHVLGKPTWTRR
jgi:hypothetical protein